MVRGRGGENTDLAGIGGLRGYAHLLVRASTMDRPREAAGRMPALHTYLGVLCLAVKLELSPEVWVPLGQPLLPAAALPARSRRAAPAHQMRRPARRSACSAPRRAPRRSPDVNLEGEPARVIGPFGADGAVARGVAVLGLAPFLQDALGIAVALLRHDTLDFVGQQAAQQRDTRPVPGRDTARR